VKQHLLLAALLCAAACGGDETKSSSAPAAAPAAKPGAKPGAKKPGQKGATLREYPKVEDRVTEGERESIRHKFKDRDFVPDPTGTENRDPFRSYVITVPGSLDTGASGTAVPVTEFCKNKKQMVATNYNLRDLRLVGIVTRGTAKFALFQDTADVGRIVHKGDCLGREKARVKDIGPGFVTLEIIPEQVPNQPVRPNEERSIPLYPDELKLSDFENNGEGDPPPSTVAPQMPSGGGAPPGPVMPDDQPIAPTPPSSEPPPSEP
jgi:Tfp pilus assembly protein PilP